MRSTVNHQVTEAQRDALFELQKADFVVVEWQLFVDTHPDDMEALRNWREAKKYAAHVRKKYESVYGPLLQSSIPSEEAIEHGWRWSGTPWPWQM